MRTDVPAFPSAAIPVDLATWPRRAVFEAFSRFSEPYHGICVRVECTETFRLARAEKLSVFLSLMHRSLVATHAVENLRTRIVGEKVVLYDTIHGGSAVGRDNGTIGFGHYRFHDNLRTFIREGAQKLAEVKSRTDLERYPGQNLIRYSVLPWLDFTSLSHARDFTLPDSAPRITFGKITESNGRATMPVSIHVHHGLADGLHVAQFVEAFEQALASPLR